MKLTTPALKSYIQSLHKTDLEYAIIFTHIFMHFPLKYMKYKQIKLSFKGVILKNDISLIFDIYIFWEIKVLWYTTVHKFGVGKM